MASDQPGRLTALRRDLGTIEAYATLLGILIGAGIFKVTTEAWALTGPSVILGYLVLAPAILATSVAYSVFLSTPLGRQPGGEYSHISRTFGGRGLAFVGAWLKIISYIGALAYLARVFADYSLQLAGTADAVRPTASTVLSVASLLIFYIVHVAGVRWFGRIQVWMCMILGVSLIVLIIPGLFAIHLANYRPMFTHGISGFAASLPPLFFAYAGFESLAQAAGETRDSTSRLPRVFIRGIGATMIIYALMSVVTFGVLSAERLRTAKAPMAEVAARYLPFSAASLVTLGAIMAITTSLNATMLVPSRVALMLAEDGLAPKAIGAVSPRTGTPIVGLTITLLAALILLCSNQVSLALNIAVFALVVLYFLHSLALLMLPRLNPELFRSATLPVPWSVQRAAAIISLLAMGTLIALQLASDINVLRHLTFQERLTHGSLTTIELVIFWGGIGALLYPLGRRRRLATGQ